MMGISAMGPKRLNSLVTTQKNGYW